MSYLTEGTSTTSESDDASVTHDQGWPIFLAGNLTPIRPSTPNNPLTHT